jgi:23S rRNA (pseudouridine1915-N3)-methyltransferase
MKIKLMAIGKTDRKELQLMIDDYCKRITHYCPFEFEIIPDLKKVKKASEAEQKKMEGSEIFNRLAPSDHLVLLDEGGKEYSSVTFSNYIQKKMIGGMRSLVFVIGGPYGFSDEIYERANERLSLSKMTFSHQMVRVFFTEQLYRAFTIIRNEPYHHH